MLLRSRTISPFTISCDYCYLTYYFIWQIQHNSTKTPKSKIYTNTPFTGLNNKVKWFTPTSVTATKTRNMATFYVCHEYAIAMIGPRMGWIYRTYFIKWRSNIIWNTLYFKSFTICTHNECLNLTLKCHKNSSSLKEEH